MKYSSRTRVAQPPKNSSIEALTAHAYYLAGLTSRRLGSLTTYRVDLLAKAPCCQLQNSDKADSQWAEKYPQDTSYTYHCA